MLSRPAHHMLNAMHRMLNALRYLQFYVAVPRQSADALCVCLMHPMTNSMLRFAVLCCARHRRTDRNSTLPVEAKYNAANDKANFARIRGSPST